MHYNVNIRVREIHDDREVVARVVATLFTDESDEWRDQA
jgi:hypothetical protein